MSPQPAPSVSIEFKLEAQPIVRCNYMTDAAEARLLSWFENHPEYLRLIQQAIAMGFEERAA